MPRSTDVAPPRPSPAELTLLRVLWSRGPSTVREVHEAVEQEHPVGYTTVLKQLQIMTDKELVTRDTSRRSHVYAAAVEEVATQKHLVSDLIDRAFGGSAAALVMRALSDEVGEEELAEIRALLENARST
ncbi:MAG: BlaI/MecI/CopY family transcriptional regulator [Alphaproteobacteria bacterium]|nr:BlaI/MecI/CopY family transcriptional regulator [Alphaproteobacteria bacterium]